jgi:hypothetical protein
MTGFDAELVVAAPDVWVPEMVSWLFMRRFGTRG